MIVCVLGGSGFLGFELVKSLTKLKINTKVVSRSRLYSQNVDYLPLSKLLNSKTTFLDDVDVIINCIGESSNLKKMKEINIELLERILRKKKI